MRALWLFLLLASPLKAAQCVNWIHYPKVKAWDFETVPLNNANIDPEVIRGWITPETPMRSVDRAKQAAKFIVNYTKNIHLRAVLMRDVLDAISKVDRHFQALDVQGTNGVIFIGRAIDTDSRYAIAISFSDGLFYRGPYRCSFDTGDGYEIDFHNRTQWTLIE